MKCIISINRKFMDYSPKDLMELIINNSTNVDGVEISIDFNDSNQVTYLEELAFECKKHNKHFQVHGNSSLSLDEQISYFKTLYPISDMLGYPINVVLHSLVGNDNNESIDLTTRYMNELSYKIDNFKTKISLENLNDTPKDDRLDFNQVTPIVYNNDNIFCTYDIGHVIADYGSITNIDDNIIDVISNVHIHTHDGIWSDGFDHKPIFENDTYWNEIIKGITLLKVKKYDGPIVFEYDLYACPGDTIQEKIISYCNSIDFVAQRIK